MVYVFFKILYQLFAQLLCFRIIISVFQSLCAYFFETVIFLACDKIVHLLFMNEYYIRKD